MFQIVRKETRNSHCWHQPGKALSRRSLRSVKSLEASFLAVCGAELSTKPCARPTIAPGYFMYKICANSFGFAALKRRLAMVVGGILRHISSQTSGSALVDLLVKTSHSKSCKLRNLRVLRISAVIDLPQVSPLLSQNKHWEC